MTKKSIYFLIRILFPQNYSKMSSRIKENNANITAIKRPWKLHKQIDNRKLQYFLSFFLHSWFKVLMQLLLCSKIIQVRYGKFEDIKGMITSRKLMKDIQYKSHEKNWPAMVDKQKKTNGKLGCSGNVKKTFQDSPGFLYRQILRVANKLLKNCFKDTKGIIQSRMSKKDKQYNGH